MKITAYLFLWSSMICFFGAIWVSNYSYKLNSTGILFLVIFTILAIENACKEVEEKIGDRKNKNV